MTSEEVRVRLSKERSRERPPISAFIMAIKDLGLFEEYDKKKCLIDIHWSLLLELLSLSSSEMMALMHKMLKSKSCSVRSVSEFDSRLRCLVSLERFVIEEIPFEMLYRAFLGQVVRRLIFQRPCDPEEVIDVYLSGNDLTTPKYKRVCARYDNRADFVRVRTLLECLREQKVPYDIICKVRTACMGCFPEIAYIVFFFT